jgi:phenylalanyl-tRNA synthetase beta chain
VARLPERKPVRMRIARARRIIGMDLPEDEMAGAFKRLAFPSRKEGDAFVVTPPSYRFDLAIEEDLVEEVARLYGFARINAHPPRPAARMLPAPERRRSLHDFRERLAASDYQEVINFSFVEPQWEVDFAGDADPIRLLNPIASHQSAMRTTLIGSLVDDVRRNHFRKVPRIRVFEVGRVFLRDPGQPAGPLAVAGVRQPMRLGGAAYGPALPEQWDAPDRAVDFFDVKGDVEALCAPLSARFEPAAHPAFHPGRSARVLLGGQSAGWLGELHPKWLQRYELPQAPVLFELDATSLLEVPLPDPRVPSRFPPVVRDIALVFDEATSWQAVLDAIEAEKPPIVCSVRLFSLYRGPGLPPGRKSLAFRVVMQHTERTLTDAEADAARETLVGLLGRKFSASLRK